ncbi:MAG: hypothetical protein NT031_19500, partial [Planctomycetota bacterium]|nr:hypothetical protein [Planctomycetota bacterium]
GTTAFVADTWNGFKAFDVSDPTKFTPLGSAVATGGAAVSFAISGTTAWVADYTNGITAVDIANPAAMTKIGSFSTWTGKATIQYAMGVAIRGNTLYVTDNGGWVIALDITDRTAPKYLGAFRAGPSPWGVQLYGSTGLLVTDGYSLRLWNVANPAKPTIISQVAISGAWQVSVRGSLAVVAGDNSFTFVDLTNPGKPRVEYTYSSPVQGGQPVFAGANVVLPMGGSGFSILAAARTITTSGTIVFPVGGITTTVSLAGGGTVQIFTTDTNPAAITGIHVIGGTSKTTLTIKTAGNAAITGGDIYVDGSLKSLTAATLDLRGDLTVTGSLQSLTVHTVSGGRTFTIAATDPSKDPAAAATLTLGMVSDLAIDSEIPLAAVTATTWISQLPAPDTIDAPSLGTLTVKGAFAPNLILDGRNSPALTLGKATISGSLASPTWSVTGAVGAISAMAWVAHWTLDHVTNIASLSLNDADFAAIDASGAIGPVKAVRWADGSLHADSVASIAVTGTGGSLSGGLGIDLTLDGASDPTKLTLGNVSVADALSGAWTVTGKLGTLSVHDLQTNLDMPTAALAGLVVGAPLVKVTPAVGLPYLLAVGYRGELFEISFASLAKWPVTTLAVSLAPGDPTPTSSEVLAALALQGIKNQFVAAKLGAWAPGVVLKPALLPSFVKSTDPLSTAGTNAKVAYIYDNALAIGALLEGTPDAESVARAFQIADAFVLLQNHDPMNASAPADTDFPTLTPAPLRDGYGFGVVAATRTATAVTVRDLGISNASSGNQAYVAMALLRAADQADAAADAARAADYRATAKELLLYIGRHRAFGGAMSGFSASGDPVNGANRVTEQNLALAGAFAVLADDELDAALKTLWQTWAASAETFRAAMYGVNPNFAALTDITDTLSYFAAGANPAGTLDNSLLSLGLGALSSLGLGDNRAVGFDLIEFLATSTDTNGQPYTGFDPGFTAASGLPDGVGTEATAYMALLAQKLGDTALLAALPDRATLTPAEQSAFDFITDRANAGSTDHDLADLLTRQLANVQLYAPNTNKLGLVASPVTGTNTGQYTLVNGLSLAATCWARFAYTGWNILT